MNLTYSNPDHPEHKDWLVKRRKRFCAIIREGKRACKLSEAERIAVIALAKLIDQGTREIERAK